MRRVRCHQHEKRPIRFHRRGHELQRPVTNDGGAVVAPKLVRCIFVVNGFAVDVIVAVGVARVGAGSHEIVPLMRMREIENEMGCSIDVSIISIIISSISVSIQIAIRIAGAHTRTCIQISTLCTCRQETVTQSSTYILLVPATNRLLLVWSKFSPCHRCLGICHRHL